MAKTLIPTRRSMRIVVARFVRAGAVIGFVVAAGSSYAGTLIYTPTNPAFGGNPANGPNLLANANAQNLPLAKLNAEMAAAAAAKASSTSAANSTPSAGQIFAEQLQSQLLSSFANQITQTIFGPNAQTSGTFTYGSTTISFVTVDQEVQISINDGSTITNITVPATN